MLRVAQVIFPRPSLLRPVPEFAWEAARAVQAAADMRVEVLMPRPHPVLAKVQGKLRKRRGAKAWPSGLSSRLVKLNPHPEIVSFVPAPRRSTEAAAMAMAWSLLKSPAPQRPNIMQGSFLDEGGYAAVKIAEVLGVPSVVVAHGTDLRAARGEVSGVGRGRRALAALSGADAIVAVSSTMAAQIEQLGYRATTIAFTASAQRYQPSPSHGTEFMFVGRLSEEKGVDLLLEAMQQLPDITVRLVGPTTDYPVEQRIRELGVGDRVIVHGEVTQAELPALYRNCRATVLPSRAEGLPCVIVESLLSGRPVVATNVGGVHELVDEDTGALVRPRDATALAHAMKEVSTQRFEADELHRRAYPFSWEYNRPRLLDLLHKTARR